MVLPDPAWLIVCASFLFATMGVCVKLASADYSPGEIVFYRSFIGALLMSRCSRRQRGRRDPRAGEHFWRSLAGVISLWLWFYAIGNCRSRPR